MAARSKAPPSTKADNMIKALGKKQKDDVQSILSNMIEILKLMKVDDDRSAPVRAQTAEQDHLEMSVRASNMIRCAESLMNLNEELKKLFFLNDFPFISQTVQRARERATTETKEAQKRMMHVYSEIQNELFDLEEENGSCWYLKENNPFAPVSNWKN